MIACVNAPMSVSHLDLGSMAYGLSHIAKESEEYREYLKGIKDRHLILDNGADELGEGMSGDEYWGLIEEIDPNEVIAPDVLGDGEETVRRTKEFVEQYKSRGATFDLMAVAQGQSLEEFESCLKELQLLPEITIIGIPYDINFAVEGELSEEWEKSAKWSVYRRELVKHLISTYQIKRQIHLLGVSRLEEFYNYGSSELEWIRSSDTTAPFAAAVESRLFVDGESGPKDWKSLDFHMESSKVFEKFSKWNLFEYFLAVRDAKAIDNLVGGVIYG